MKMNRENTARAASGNRAFEQGTSEYWTRHAERWEAEGRRAESFVCRRAAEKAAAAEGLEAIGWGGLERREESLMLAEAMKLLRPAQRGFLRKKLKRNRAVCHVESWRLPRIVYEKRAS